jgi:hypothetical protein
MMKQLYHIRTNQFLENIHSTLMLGLQGADQRLRRLRLKLGKSLPHKNVERPPSDAIAKPLSAPSTRATEAFFEACYLFAAMLHQTSFTPSNIIFITT